MGTGSTPPITIREIVEFAERHGLDKETPIYIEIDSTEQIGGVDEVTAGAMKATVYPDGGGAIVLEPGTV